MRDLQYAELQGATTLDATATSTGTVNVSGYDRLVFWVDYILGDENFAVLTPKYLAVAGGDEHEHMEWSVADAQLKTAKTFKLTASGKAYIVLDVKSVSQVKLYQNADGGTPTGTLQVSYTLLREST